MSKDPRVNWYPDNWAGGTKRMDFEQKGAYMELLMLNFYCLSDGLTGFTEAEALKALACAAAYAELWEFLKPKFKTDGTYYWSARMTKEFHKSKKHSEKQSERANKRWASPTAHAAALPVNGTGIGNGIEIKNNNESEENPKVISLSVSRETDDPLPGALVWNDEMYRESLTRLARDHGITNLQNLRDRWEGWYVNKFDWRKKQLQEMRLSFESWIKDPKSKQILKSHGNNQQHNKENRSPAPKSFGTL